MQHRSNVSPVPLFVNWDEQAIELEYLDNRIVTYRGPFESRDRQVTSTRGFEFHVLVIDPGRDEGVMVYLNDYDTVDEILESTGVGRILLSDQEQVSVFPGITARRDGESIEVVVDDAVRDVLVFAFVESERGEQALCLATPTREDSSSLSNANDKGRSNSSQPQ